MNPWSLHNDTRGSRPEPGYVAVFYVNVFAPHTKEYVCARKIQELLFSNITYALEVYDRESK